MRLAIDASAAAVASPTGVAVYIEGLLRALPSVVEPEDHIVACYRFSRLRRRALWVRPDAANVSLKLIQEPLNVFFAWGLDVFHGADVRVPRWRSPVRVATVHDLFSVASDDYGDARFRKNRRRHYRNTVARADRIITHSETVRQALVSRLEVAPQRVCVVPLAPRERPPPNREQVAAVCSRLGLTPGRFLLAVGEISRRKGGLTLLEAHRRLCASLQAVGQQAPDLVMVGRRGHGSEEIFTELAIPVAGAAVSAPGWLGDSDVACLLHGATAFVQASRDEGFGMAVLEAMAAGCPVVATAAGAVPEVAGDGASLVAPGQPEALARALEQVVSDNQMARGLAERGAARARKFSWESTARTTLNVYREALAERRSTSIGTTRGRP